MARNLGNYYRTGEIAPFVSRTFEKGVAIAAFFSVLSVVPRHCARLTHILHPKLREMNAVLMTPQRRTLTLRQTGSIPSGAASEAPSLWMPPWSPPVMHCKEERSPPPPPPGRAAYTQPLSP